MTEYAERKPLPMQMKLTYAAVGILLGAVLTFGVLRFSVAFAEEEQPPIIVRGGSLIFENGNTFRPGKPWKTDDPATKKTWRLQHGQGRSVTGFWVVPTSAGSTCPAYSGTNELKVFYTVSGVTKTFTVGISTPGGGTKAGPMIVGEEPLTEDTSASVPTLIYGPGLGGSFEFEIKNGSNPIRCTADSLVLLF